MKIKKQRPFFSASAIRANKNLRANGLMTERSTSNRTPSEIRTAFKKAAEKIV